MDANAKTRILCVDDEPNVVESIALHLRRHYDVETATSGAAGLEILGRNGAVAVVVSDMRMPGMDGATFLKKAREAAPNTVRMMLTGQSDLNATIAAVNEGQIFRFLTKPCAPPLLLAAVGAAAEQNRLITAEQVLLEHTLHGSIKTLTDVLSLTSPASFGRANRIKQLVSEVAARLGMKERWQVEVAAMLSQLGCITLPEDVVEKVNLGQPLSEPEQKFVARMPVVTEQLLGNIPRLEVVREILASGVRPSGQVMATLSDADKQVAVRGAQLLRVALDFDVLEAQGNTASMAIDTLRGRAGRYDKEVVEALAAVRGGASLGKKIRELPLSGLRVGMVFAEDVRMVSGTLLVARGNEVTPSLMERARSFRSGMVREPVRVVVSTTAIDP